MTNIEGAPTEVRTLEAFGNTYELADKIPMILYMKYAKLGTQGKMSTDMEALAISYDMVRLSLADKDQARFEEDAANARADENELGDITRRAVEIISARPTGPLSASSDGQPTTTPNSTVTSSDTVEEGTLLTFEQRKKAMGMVPVTAANVEALLA